MVVVTFTQASVAKILAGRKCGTTRLPTRQWLRIVGQIAEGRRVDAHIWNGSPRSGGELLFKGAFVRGLAVTGAEFDGEMILKDGFEKEIELAAGLWKFYGKGKATPESALEWFRAQRWTWFEWETPPAVEVAQEALEQVPLNLA